MIIATLRGANRHSAHTNVGDVRQVVGIHGQGGRALDDAEDHGQVGSSRGYQDKAVAVGLQSRRYKSDGLVQAMAQHHRATAETGGTTTAGNIEGATRGDHGWGFDEDGFKFGCRAIFAGRKKPQVVSGLEGEGGAGAGHRGDVRPVTGASGGELPLALGAIDGVADDSDTCQGIGAGAIGHRIGLVIEVGGEQGGHGGASRIGSIFLDAGQGGGA